MAGPPVLAFAPVTTRSRRAIVSKSKGKAKSSKHKATTASTSGEIAAADRRAAEKLAASDTQCRICHLTFRPHLLVEGLCEDCR